MHGLIFNQLEQFVTKNHGHAVWEQIEKASGSETPIFLPTKMYDDKFLFSILQAAEKTLNVPGDQILFSFGEYMAPQLIKIYSHSIKPEWTVIDLLEHTENTMHKAVRFADKLADPPKLNCKRIQSNAVEISYRSPRGIIAFGKGVISGFSKAYNQPLQIVQSQQGEATILRISMTKN
ncbi:MAG: heme NO-binding domain-containing protein [Cyclobacteriaceae bacterium]|jgi:hypothetical protein|nr:heme NO-binding domain-containing protein [Cyclobacteriaceae bacterium]